MLIGKAGCAKSGSVEEPPFARGSGGKWFACQVVDVAVEEVMEVV